MATTVEERFWNKVDLADGDGCWLWTASTKAFGYGHFNAEGRTVIAHRFAYELLVGPIPKDKVIDHLCRVPACVNPLHLEVVTQRTNVLRGDAPAAQQHRRTHCPKGHPLSGDNLSPSSKWYGRKCRTCTITRAREWRARKKAEVGVSK